MTPCMIATTIGFTNSPQSRPKRSLGATGTAYCGLQMIFGRLSALPVQLSVGRAGYAESNGEMSPGLSVVAVPLPSLVGKIPMAVGDGGNSARIHEKEHILNKLTNLQGQFGEGAADPSLVAA